MFAAATYGRPLLSNALQAQINQLVSSASVSRYINKSVSDAIKLPRGLFDPSSAFSQVTVGQARNLITAWPSAATLTRPETYRNPDPPRGRYSPFMESAATYFDRQDQVIIDSVDSLNRAIEKLVDKTPDLTLVWRGARDASWGVHSHLFRRLMEVNGVKEPQTKPRSPQPYPDEDQMIAAEAQILQVARTEWRFDGLSALETFARIQHAGGPTRLLDVTKNPYIAAWFAVEPNSNTDGVDARLFAFATQPVASKDSEHPPRSLVELDAEWGGRLPAWHFWTDSVARQAVDWGTGARRRLWVPPQL